MANERHRFHFLHHSNQAVRGEQAKQSATRKRFRVTTALVLPALLSMLVLLAGCGVEDVGGLLSEPQPSATVALAGVPAATGTAVAGEEPASQDGQPAATPTEAPAAPTEAPAAGGQGGGALTTMVEYTVKSGDTLSQIAFDYDTTVEAIMAANGLSDSTIYAGQTLKVPTTVGVAAAAPTPGSQQEPVPAGGGAQPQTAPPAETTATPAPAPEDRPEPVVVNGRTYDAYNQAVIKKGQWYHYTCEFDAAWVVLKTYGFDIGLEEQVAIIGHDTSIEPYYEETADGIVIYGGDVTQAYSGDYKTNFLARSSGQAMRKVFEHFGLKVTAVRDRPSLEAALLRGDLVWIKTTVDFKPWREATWVMPDGRSYKTVLGNDHALVVMGFNEDGVVIRDPLGPTSTNWERKYEYEVPWDRFLASWGAQEYDGLAVAPPEG